MTRELGKIISSIRIRNRRFSVMLVVACLMPGAYADGESDHATVTLSSETLVQNTVQAPASDPTVTTDASGTVESAVPLNVAVEELLPNYAKLTHHQLTKIGARWDQLGDAERRGLLNEVKLRMARQKGSERTLRIRTQRRYGRIVRRSDGKVLRIETKVIQVAPVRRNSAESSFGVGFERRHAEPDQSAAGSADPARELIGGEPTRSAPARRVKDNHR